MNVKIVLFQIGAGGNFLSRVATLDDNTVPLGGYTEDSNYLSTSERFLRYQYSNIPKDIIETFDELLPNGLTKWVDYELFTMFFPLTIGFEKLIKYNQTVVEFVHPEHYYEKLTFFGNDDCVETYWLDSSGCLDWVYRQGSTKTTVRSIKEVNDSYCLMKQIAEKENASSFSLLNILNSFETEYLEMCNKLNVKAHMPEALGIYHSWKKTWQ